MLSPWLALAIIVVALLVVLLVDSALFNRRRRHLLAIAREFHVRYSPVDRFQLLSRVAASLDSLAAAQIAVRDVMYARQADAHCYCFTIQYIVGTFTQHEQNSRVAMVREPVDRSVDRFDEVEFARSNGELEKQYREVLARISAG